MNEQRLGLIAGFGQFPAMVLEGAKNAGCEVTVVGIRGLADRSLFTQADHFYWAGIARLGRWIRLLRRHEIQRVILAGSVRKAHMYGRFRFLRFLPDWTVARIWFFHLPDKRNDTVLSAVADEMSRRGLTMESCVQYTPQHMAPEGVLTRRQPTAAQRRDAEFGWKLAKQVGGLDIGQAIAVKETDVIAVEAIEGTDRMIDRAGELCPQGGWTLVKVAKPNQDMRFDVPTVGPETIARLKSCRAAMLVIEAGKTLLVDRAEMIDRADRAGLVILGMSEQ